MRRILTVVVAWAAAHQAAAWLFRRKRAQYAGARKHLMVVQGGAELRPGGDEIDDAVVSVLMGGLLLDLRQAQPTRRPARLDVLCVMGGVDLVVPEDWLVRMNIETTMGGVRDTRADRMQPERPADLVVTGRVVMGGLEILSTMPGLASRRAATVPVPG